jgi:predicted acetyltransferase
MCGIVGYVGHRPVQEILLSGLEKLEYRGYDSAGISLQSEGRLDSVRAVGNLQALRAAVTADAYALYAVKPRFAEGGPAGEVVVREVMAASEDGLAAIWGFLLGLDLTTKLTWELAAADDPLPHMVLNAQHVRVWVWPALWLRVVDVPRALAERSYAHPLDVVLAVSDDVCPWNAGRWALRWDGSTATCARTATPAALELGVAELGAAYLGGTTLEQLARAGRVRELRSGALATASRAFQGARAPWCPENF